MEDKKIKEYKKILIVNLGGIGDMLLSTAALKAIRNSFPHAYIALLTTDKVAKLAESFNFLDTVHGLQLGYGGRVSLVGMLKLGMILLRLRMEKFDIAVNMRTLVSDASARKIKMLFDIIKPVISCGRDTDERGSFFNIKIPESRLGKKYERDYDLDTAAAIGAQIREKEITLDIPVSAFDHISILFKNKKINTDLKIIGIHPGGMPTRQWPIENFKQLVSKIGGQSDCLFVVTGGEKETVLAEELKKVIPERVFSFAGELSVMDTAALIKRCNVFISNDTGPMHIAAVLKTPLIALFGPGDIVRFDPRVIFPEAVVFYNKTECAPCEKVNCESLKCLKLISVEKVADEAIRILKRYDLKDEKY